MAVLRGKLKKLQVYRDGARQILGSMHEPIAERTFARLEAEGIIVPTIRGKGRRPSVYDLTVIVPAYITHLNNARPAGGGERDARARRDRSVADLNELRSAQLRKELLPRTQVALEGQTFVKAVQAKLRALPRQLIQTGLVARIHEAALIALVREALEEMARWSSMEDLLTAAGEDEDQTTEQTELAPQI